MNQNNPLANSALTHLFQRGNTKRSLSFGIMDTGTRSPGRAYRYLPEGDYIALITAIDDRNKLSHIYDQAEIELIVSRLPAYALLMQRIVETLRKGCDDTPKVGAGGTACPLAP